MRTFDDYSNREINERIQLCLRSNEELQLSPWELTNFLSNFSSYYYKIEILETLTNALCNGINPRNIIIFDESFKLNKSYKNFNTIDLDSNLHELYYIGKPVSLYPNDNVENIYLLFKYFRLVNEHLFRSKSQRLNARDISRFYKKIHEVGLIETLNFIFNMAKRNIENIKNQRYIDKIHNDFLKELKKYQSASIAFSSIESGFDETLQLSQDEEKKYNVITNRYYNKFIKYLIRLPRPLIGIFYSETEKFEVLARAHINKSERNSTYLDIKEVSHNSPLKALLEGGASIYATFKDEQRKNEIHILQKEKLELEIDNQKKEKEIKELELLKKKIEVREKFEEYNKNVENRINRIGYPYVQKQMMKSYNKVQKSGQKLLSDNNMTIDYDSTITLKA